MSEDDLTTRITRTLEEAGIYVDADRADGAITLLGEVESDENRQAAIDVAQAVAGPAGLTVIDQLEVMAIIPEDAFGTWDQATSEIQLTDNPDTSSIGDEASPDQPLEPDFTGDVGTTDPIIAVEQGITYFPPTDTVVLPADSSEELEVIGGFAATAMDDEASSSGLVRGRGDDEIADAVRRELISDALTTDLEIEVAVNEGTVILTGSVPSLDDAEAAEAVASRVPGIVEVREELTIDPGYR